MKRQTQFWMNVARIAGALVITTLSLEASRPTRVQAAPVPQALDQTVTPSTTITIEGVVSSITGDSWVVGGVTITLTPQTIITGYPVVGSVVQVLAVPGENNRLVAQTITLVAMTATPGPSATPSATPTITLTGTVGPSLTPSITPTATLTGTPGPSPTPVPYVIIVIEGPVEEINVNIIVVYGQRIKLRPDDPVLVKLKVGDWVHVDGDFEQDSDNTIVVVVVTIIIINPPPTIIILPPPPPSGNGDDDHGHHEGDD